MAKNSKVATPENPVPKQLVRGNLKISMKTIYYNSAVARHCGNNGIIKAVLLNYIYNYHKINTRKGSGYPACIFLREFVYQYESDTGNLWGRSFIHKILKDLERDDHLTITPENGQCVYAVSPEIALLLSDKEAKIVAFDLGIACGLGIHVAIVVHYLRHVIGNSPNGEAYNLSITEMAEVNRLSPAQIYRAIDFLVSNKILMRIKSKMRFRSRKMGLALYKPVAG